MFRVYRDKAKSLAILNRMDESYEYFSRAESFLGNEEECKNKIKYARLLNNKALSSIKFSPEKSLELFEKQITIYVHLFEKKRENFFIYSVIFELGRIRL